MTTAINTLLEETLKNILQKQIKLQIGNKVIKQGKFLLFKQINYNIELVLKIDGVVKRFEIPAPYAVRTVKNSDNIIFDYKIKTLAHNNTQLEKTLKMVAHNTSNKYLDKELKIVAL